MARIVIVGAGIVGLSAARAAALRGHEVTVIERDKAPNPSAASFDQHRLIRFQYGDAEGYTRMVRAAFGAWDRLWVDLGARHFADTGTLAISTRAGDHTALTEATLQRLDIPHEVLDGNRLHDTCTHLNLPEDSRGILVHPGGPLFADRILRDLRAFCESEGVVFLEHTRVTDVQDDGTVTMAGGAVLHADFVIVAAGAWLPALLPARYGALPTWRQAVCYVEAPAAHRERWVRGPALVGLGDTGVYTLPPADGTTLKFGYGAHRRRAAPSAGFDWQLTEGRDIIAGFGNLLRDAASYRPLRMKVGYYVMNDSRHFQLDRAGRCLFLTNCDGQMFKFGPLLGERALAAFEGEWSFADLSAWAAGQTVAA